MQQHCSTKTDMEGFQHTASFVNSQFIHYFVQKCFKWCGILHIEQGEKSYSFHSFTSACYIVLHIHVSLKKATTEVKITVWITLQQLFISRLSLNGSVLFLTKENWEGLDAFFLRSELNKKETLNQMHSIFWNWLYMEEKRVAIVRLASYCGEWPGVEKEGNTSGTAARSDPWEVVYRVIWKIFLSETARTKIVTELWWNRLKWPKGKEGNRLRDKNDYWAKLKLTITQEKKKVEAMKRTVFIWVEREFWRMGAIWDMYRLD